MLCFRPHNAALTIDLHASNRGQLLDVDVRLYGLHHLLNQVFASCISLHPYSNMKTVRPALCRVLTLVNPASYSMLVHVLEDLIQYEKRLSGVLLWHG